MSDFIHISAIASISFVTTIFFYLDIFLHTDKKKNWFFVRAVFWLIPALFAENIIGEDNRDIFYISLLISLFIFAAVTKVWCCIFLNKERNKLFPDDTFTYFDLLHKGYPSFKLNVEKSISKQSRIEKRNERGFVKLNKELKFDLPKFIAKIYLALDSKTDAMAYCFTLREYDEESNIMIAIWSTDKDRIPGKIPLEGKNMITRAVELDGPAVYSRNKRFHAKGNGNIEKGLYIDYVTICLLKDASNKPLFSVCLDVKNQKSKNRLLALVDSNVLQIISLAMQSKLQKDL